MDSLWDRIKTGVIESASVAAEKAEYLGRIGRARLDIAETRHAIRDRFADLGGLVYERLESDEDSGNLADNKEVEALRAAIASLEVELEKREEALDLLRAEGDDAHDDKGVEET